MRPVHDAVAAGLFAGCAPVAAWATPVAAPFAHREALVREGGAGRVREDGAITPEVVVAQKGQS